MISATAWIAKGKAREHPIKYSIDDAELERVGKLANVHFEDAKTQFRRAQKVAQGWNTGEENGNDNEDEEWDDEDESDKEEKIEEKEDTEMKIDETDEMAKYNLDKYDDIEETDDAMRLGPFTNIKGLQFYRNNEEDPYITLKDDPMEDEEEKEDLRVRKQDNLIICAKTEDDVSSLQAYLYDSEDSNLFVHHDLMLPSFPLCLEWLDFQPTGSFTADQNSNSIGNFIAVGTMDPEIEIWNMDVTEGLFPDALLGQRELTKGLDGPLGTGKKKRKQPKERKSNANYHVDAVLSLSWNHSVRNILASASADATIKLWDLTRSADENSGGISALRSFDSIHKDKVQSITWDTSNSSRGQISQPARLLSGGYDKRICIFDSRSPDSSISCLLKGDIECLKWDPWHEHAFIASTDDGLVQSFDARNLGGSSPALASLIAHDSACTAIDLSPHIPGCLVTGGTDKLIKLWNIRDTNEQDSISTPKSISLVTSRDLDAGKLFTVQFSPDDPLTIVAGGSLGNLRIWNALSNVGARKAFSDQLHQFNLHAQSKGLQTVQLDGKELSRGDGIIKIEDESDEDDDEDEEGK